MKQGIAKMALQKFLVTQPIFIDFSESVEKEERPLSKKK